MNKIFELPTGYGKSALALKEADNLNPGQWTLIVVPKLVLIDNWKKEIKKWGYDERNFDFVTYNSIDDKIATYYKNCICDEAHHITDRVKRILNCMKPQVENWFFLSATIKQDLRYYLQMTFDANLIKKNMADAIDEGKIPEPTVYLIPLELDNVKKNISVTKHIGKNNFIKKFTQREYIDDMEGLISWYKNKVMTTNNDKLKVRWLSQCLKRNKELSRFKESFTRRILEKLKNKRVLTFCCDIGQTECLGKNFINSKNKNSLNILNDFNDGKINHITSCNILAEGVNIFNCEYGIFNFINSSEVLVIQKLGRILRHKQPKIIIPYFTFTREEELVAKMLEGINPDRIKKVELGMMDYVFK